MAHIGILGLGNWGTAIAAMWLKDGHNVKGWTIEKEVYQSIMMKDENSVYLEGVSVKGLDVTMHLEEALQGVEIIVLAVPSSVILNVVNDLILLLRSHPVLSDHEVVPLCQSAIHGSRITSVLEWSLPKL